MQIVEVKNNLVRISYDTLAEKLILSGFVVIKDSSQSFIAQIVHLEAESQGNFAIAKLLFNFDENGVVSNYNGSVPDVKSIVDVVHPQEILELLPVQNPLVMGDLAQQETLLTLDRSMLEEKLLVCSEKEEDTKLLVKNLASQLDYSGKKLLVIDINGDFDFSQNKIVAGKDFKLPLNYDTINFIYEKGLDDAKAETRALIQDVFLEVQKYVKTLSEKFIPFETFKDTVARQYEETGFVELVLLKNKLLKYYEAGIFAQEKSEFNSLKIALKRSNATILDLSGVDEKIQREMISYAYSLIKEVSEQTKRETYVIFNVNNSNSDKKLLKQIFTTEMAYSTLICSYSYKYLKELKQLSKNLILFAPIQQQNDFAGYNTFLAKLNPHEFIVYGQATHHLPLIVKLDEIIRPASENSAPTSEEVPFSQESLLDEEIKRDVDEIYTVPKSEETEKETVFEQEIANDGLTEEDLDFIDDFNIVEKEVVDENVAQMQPDLAEKEFEAGKNIEIFEKDQTGTFSEVLVEQEKEEQEPTMDILPVRAASTPIVPIYSAEVEPKAQSDEVVQGDIVMHPKYGRGTVEKLISYGSKTLCSINFDNVGRRLLDPTLAEIKKAS
ncbi:MAG: hypothetical protein WCY19_08390 [Candidatus Gastranaerophilaceae bacterium]